MTTAILLAAGKGVRLGSHIRKQYLLIGEYPILVWSLRVFDACDEIDRIVLVVPDQEVDYCQNRILNRIDLQKKIRVLCGGAKRQESVYNSLLAVEDKEGIVVIHDAVRPFLRQDQIKACIQGAQDHGAAILGIPADSTLKQVGPSGQIEKTVERRMTWMAQTPQAFRYRLIMKAHERAKKQGFVGTDDAILVERLGETIQMLKGSRMNFKITTQADLELARAMAEVYRFPA